MTKLEEKDVKEVLEYLEKNIQECVYLYIDIKVYGIRHSNMNVWISRDGEKINTVVMKYFDSFQIFSAYDNWDKEGVLELLMKYKVTTVAGKKSLIKQLAECVQDMYSVAYGVVIEEDKYREFKQFELVEEARDEDALEIAELMCTDEEFANNYEVSILAKQLIDRMQTGMGKSYIIRQEGKIVAHVAVFAQTDKVAVESGLIVDEQMKKNMYGMILHEYIKKVLINEGKRVFAFRIKDSMLRCTTVAKVGVCSEYGKLTRENCNV